jgi:hypothetical protein
VTQKADVRGYFIDGLFGIVIDDETCAFPMTLFSSAEFGIYQYIKKDNILSFIEHALLSYFHFICNKLSSIFFM